MSVSSIHDNEQYKVMKESQDFFRDIIEAVMNNKLIEVQSKLNAYLKSHPNITINDIIQEFQSEGKTLLHIASSSGHLRIVQYLVQQCTDIKKVINLADNQGMTPIINATIAESSDIMRYFIELGADVNIVNKDGASCLHFAASDGSLTRLEILDNAGADFNVHSSAGNALHWAAGKGRHDAVRFLIKKGVNVNELSDKGLPPIIMAVGVCSEECVSALLEAKANIGYILAGNLTLLHMCAEYGMIKAVSLIIETDEGLKCNEVATVDDNYPIHLAAMAGHIQIVKLLLPVSHSNDILNLKSIIHDEDKIVNAILDDGKQRMKTWEAKYKDNTSNNMISTETKSKSNRILESTLPAKDEASKLLSEEFKSKGNIAFTNKEFSRAIIEYTKAIEYNGSNEVLWSNRSAAYLSNNDPDNALLDAEVCRRLNPKWSKGCYRLAAARLALSLFEDAAVAAFEGVKLDEGNTELKKLLQTAVSLGQEEHKKKTTNSNIK